MRRPRRGPAGIGARQQARFDAILEDELDALPDAILELLEVAPLIVEDRPTGALLRELGLEGDPDGLCGLHTGVPLTERTVEDPTAAGLETIRLFRAGILAEAGGPDASDADLRREIRITLLHEIGHHFGLEEDDLEALGYG